jgi:hypothetical protein
MKEYNISVPQIISKIRNCLTQIGYSHSNIKLSRQLMKDWTVPTKRLQSLESMAKEEMRFFEYEAIIPLNLQLVNDYLSTTAPSSIESDRALSAVDEICTKIKSSLEDNIIISYVYQALSFFGLVVWILKYNSNLQYRYV